MPTCEAMNVEPKWYGDPRMLKTSAKGKLQASNRTILGDTACLQSAWLWRRCPSPLNHIPCYHVLGMMDIELMGLPGWAVVLSWS